MDENVITEEDGMVGSSANKQMKMTLQSREQLERQQENQKGFLRRQETWAPKHG